MQGLNIIENSTICDGDLEIGISPSQIAKNIAAGEMYIVKNVFNADDLRTMTMDVFHVYDDIEPKFSKYYWGMPNHWRKDDNPPKSTIPKLLSLYFSFLWNDDFPKVRKIAGILHRFRNRINGLPLVYGLKEEDEHWAIPLLQHFPVGGGFINQHNDPLEPQKCVVSLTLIKDFKTGGLYTNPTGKVKIPLEPMIGPGDLFVFRPDIFHGVDPIDPDLPKDYRNPFGRWRMSCILSSKS